jgi:uncharacterized protein YcaQ
VAGRALRGEPLSLDEARRTALAAQGLGGTRSGRSDAQSLRRVTDRLGVLQVDSVNVLVRSHYLAVFTRVGGYPRATLDRMAWGPTSQRRLFEYWGHKASLLPLDLHPLLRWRMDAARAHVFGGDIRQYRTLIDPALLLAPWAVIEGMWRLGDSGPALAERVLAVLAERGPVAAGEIEDPGERRLESGGLWNWNDVKVVLEWLLYAGQVTVASRRGFRRVYDLTERVLPAEVLDRPAPWREDAQRELTRIAARAYGVAGEPELRDYFHLPAAESKARVAELVGTGELVPVDVDGVRRQSYRWHEARTPATVETRALLSPFDSLIWDRDRTLALFGFHYRIGIYTPAAQRTHGYYVLPFLLGDRLVARVDLRSERDRSTLVVPEAHAERVVGGRRVAARTVVTELAEELALMADWLELDRIEVGDRGDLAAPLRRAVR